ncbi:GyrI-like domain-containing protein [Thermodesulfitimonas sp.]
MWPVTEVKELPPVRVAYVVRQGAYDGLADAFHELCARVEAQGVTVVGPPVLVYRSHPEGVPPAFREWELQLPVAGEVTGKEGG